MSTFEQPPAAPDVPPARPNRPAHARPRVAPSQPPAQTQSASAGVKPTQAEASATAEELRAFIARSRGKSPQEVLGAMAQGGLFKSTAVASGMIVGLLLLLTIVPFALGDRGQPVKTEPVANGAKADAGSTTGAPAPKTNPNATATAATATPTNTTSSGDPALKALSIDETTTADPNKNPLENSLDDLLDKIPK